MTPNVLSDKDVNASVTQYDADTNTGKSDIKTMEYHRQVLQSKIEQEK
jgi:hypothetical protein